MAELRSFILIDQLQPRTLAYIATWMRGSLPRRNMAAQIIEFAPALAIHRITDLALKAAPDMEPGILFTERQFGLLELHSSDKAELEAAGRAIPKGIGAKATDQLAPAILFHDIIKDLSDQHAIILNRSRDASILVPGASLLVCEMAPALFACVAASEAGRAAPDATLNDVQMMGASGRVFMSGDTADLKKAQQAITKTLAGV